MAKGRSFLLCICLILTPSLFGLWFMVYVYFLHFVICLDSFESSKLTKLSSQSGQWTAYKSLKLSSLSHTGGFKYVRNNCLTNYVDKDISSSVSSTRILLELRVSSDWYRRKLCKIMCVKHQNHFQPQLVLLLKNSISVGGHHSEVL